MQAIFDKLTAALKASKSGINSGTMVVDSCCLFLKTFSLLTMLAKLFISIHRIKLTSSERLLAAAGLRHQYRWAAPNHHSSESTPYRQYYLNFPIKKIKIRKNLPSRIPPEA